MAENKRWDRAVAFCRQASLIAPDAPQPYADCLGYAREAKDVEAMEWAYGNLVKHDWPTQNDQLHGKAQDELKRLKDVLQKEKNVDADKLLRLDSARRNLERDLVIKLSWQGQADLDLEVKEPIGTICSFQQRQTPGGGTLLGDNLSDANHETYVAAEAFSGKYEVTVKRVWGRPQGAKVVLEVVEHQGTPQERTLYRDTIVADFEAKNPSKEVTLLQGRRTSVANVLPASLPTAQDERKDKLMGSDQVLNKLRALSDNGMLGGSTGVSGGFGDLPPISVKMSPGAQRSVPLPSFQGKAASVVQNGIDMTYRPVVSADRRVVGVSLNPVFQTLNRAGTVPNVLNPAIPGGR
jgi:hypothetical protein